MRVAAYLWGSVGDQEYMGMYSKYALQDTWGCFRKCSIRCFGGYKQIDGFVRKANGTFGPESLGLQGVIDWHGVYSGDSSYLSGLSIFDTLTDS